MTKPALLNNRQKGRLFELANSRGHKSPWCFCEKTNERLEALGLVKKAFDAERGWSVAQLTDEGLKYFEGLP